MIRNRYMALIVVACTALISSHAVGDPVEWPLAAGGNGHFYEAVSYGDCSWHHARNMAHGRSWQGCAGELMTVTSAEEHEWFLQNVGGFQYYWLGGCQQAGSAEPADGWEWVTGEPWDYTSWYCATPNECEPNNLGDEWLLQTIWRDFSNDWNDVNNYHISAGFFVEYNITVVPTSSESFGAIKAMYK
jgi:hypothetical protein